MEAFLEFFQLCLLIAYGAVSWAAPYVLVISLPPLLFAAGYVVIYSTRHVLRWDWITIVVGLCLAIWCLSTLPSFPF